MGITTYKGYIRLLLLKILFEIIEVPNLKVGERKKEIWSIDELEIPIHFHCQYWSEALWYNSMFMLCLWIWNCKVMTYDSILMGKTLHQLIKQFENHQELKMAVKQRECVKYYLFSYFTVPILSPWYISKDFLNSRNSSIHHSFVASLPYHSMF